MKNILLSFRNAHQFSSLQLRINLFRPLLFLLLFSSLIFSAAANSSITQPGQHPPGNGDSSWVKEKTIGNVEFYYQMSLCNGSKVVFLKFINKNSYNVKVSWKEMFDTQNEHDVAGFQDQKQLVILPGETFQSDCNNIKCRECLIQPNHVSPTHRVEIVKFQFKDVSVNSIK